MDLHNKLKDENVVFVSVCIDNATNNKKALDFLKSKKATLTNYWIAQGKGKENLYTVAAAWGFGGFPATFVVDRKGEKTAVKTLDEAEKIVNKLQKAA